MSIFKTFCPQSDAIRISNCIASNLEVNSITLTRNAPKPAPIMNKVKNFWQKVQAAAVYVTYSHVYWVQHILPFSTYFTSKTVIMVFDPSRSSKVKSDCANQKPMVAFEVLLGVQSRIGHHFQDISNQRTVTLSFNLSRSSTVKPIGTLYIIPVGSNIVTPAVLDIFHVNKYDLDFLPLRSSEVKCDGANQKRVGPTYKCSRGSNRVSHYF